jgi:hypothetical protein
MCIPSGQAEAGLAAGHRRGCSPITSRHERQCTGCFSRRSSIRRTIRAVFDQLARRWRDSDRFDAQAREN